MFKYIENLFGESVAILVILGAALANWFWPLYLWLGDTDLYRFIWLAIFFILLDILIEIVTHASKEISLVADNVTFYRDIKKISGSFHLVPKISLENGLKADFAVVGSSGVWLITVQDDGGEITFNGDDIMQNGVVLAKVLPKALEKAYSLAVFLKKNLAGRDFKVSPVLVFTSPAADLKSIPKMVRGVYVASHKDIIPLIENTDVQLIDKNTIEEIYALLKNGKHKAQPQT